ncbi:MAG: hypothetical protein JO111_13675 [Caulobacteraceae bacterium]|nr:hypothetical protein [Caulobacteraceae bacterium]
MIPHAAVWRTASDAVSVLSASFGEVESWEEGLETARAWMMVALLWSGFQAMKIAAQPIQM